MVSSSLGMEHTFTVRKHTWVKRKRLERIIVRLGILLFIGLTGIWTLFVITENWILPAVWPVFQSGGHTSLTLNHPIVDTDHQLSASDTQNLRETLTALDTMLQANSHLLLQHPLAAIEALPLSQRDIILAFDPTNQQLALRLGPGLWHGAGNAMLVLGGNSQAFLQGELAPLSHQSLHLPIKLELMLRLIGQHFIPNFSHSKIHLPQQES